MDEQDWHEPGAMNPEPGESPILAVSYYDSAAEMRGQVAHCWQALREAHDFPDSRAAMPAGGADGLGLVVEVDAGLECALQLYPLVDGRARYEWGQGSGQPLFQLSDDGAGWIDPEQLWAFVEYLLDDILPLVRRHNRAELLERFHGGRRSLQLCDPCGRLLEMPEGFASGVARP